MPLAVNDVIQVTVIGEKDGQAVLNVFHYQCTVAPSTGTPADNMTSLVNQLWAVDAGELETLWMDVMPADYVLLAARGQRVAPTRSAYVEVALIDNGEIAADTMDTANLAWVFVKQSELAGRRGKGTTHMLLPASTWIENGRIGTEGAAARASLLGQIPNQTSPAGGGVFVPIIYHPNFSPNFSRITHCTQKSEVRTMRRRTVGRGI